MVCRNRRLQGELNELHAKIGHPEENRLKTTDDWKPLEDIKDTALQLRNDNDRLKQNIGILSEEKDSALSR